MPRQQNYFFTFLFLSFFRFFFQHSYFSCFVSRFRFSLLTTRTLFFFTSSIQSLLSRCFFSFENHRFRSAAALLPNLHSVVMMFVVIVSLCCLSCFLRLLCEASVPERRKNVHQTTREVCSIYFFGDKQVGSKGEKEGRKPSLPFPTLTRTFTFRGQLVSCCRCCFCLFCFFLCQKLKTWSLFALYSLEMLSTLSLTVICWLLVFEGCPSKPLYQSWLTTPFAKMTGVVSTIIL